MAQKRFSDLLSISTSSLPNGSKHFTLCASYRVDHFYYISNFLYITPTNIPLYNCLIYPPFVVINSLQEQSFAVESAMFVSIYFFGTTIFAFYYTQLNSWFQIDLFNPQWFRTKYWHRFSKKNLHPHNNNNIIVLATTCQ